MRYTALLVAIFLISSSLSANAFAESIVGCGKWNDVNWGSCGLTATGSQWQGSTQVRQDLGYSSDYCEVDTGGNPVTDCPDPSNVPLVPVCGQTTLPNQWACPNCKADAAKLDSCPNYKGVFSNDGDASACVVKCDKLLDSNWYQGKWDGSVQQCVQCSGAVKTSVVGGTSAIGCPFPVKSIATNSQSCESACGASPECDERATSQLGSSNTFTASDGKYGYCDSGCKFQQVTTTTCSGSTPYYDPNLGKCVQCSSRPDNNNNADSDCIAQSKTCESQGFPNRYAQCNTNTNTCDRCDPCQKNSQCTLGSCCVDATDDPNAPLTGTGQCKSKSILSSETPSTGKPASSYLCDPGEWIKCDYSKINANYTFNNNTYTCVLENGDYKWIVSLGVPQQKPKTTLFEIIVQFFKSLFR